MKQLGNRYNQHSFAQIPQVNMARSRFDRSFSIKDTFDFDFLIPILVDEILPGDTINLNLQSFARLATQVVPLMDNMYLDYFFFFVPNRLVWTNWERFNGAQDDPNDSTDFTVPVINVTGFPAAATVGSIYDKMGLPVGGTTMPNNIIALPFRGYNLIWNEWFRDQNLQNSILVPKGDGPDAPSTYTLLKRAKKHDYFTSCLPWPQKGDPVELSITGMAPVIVDPTGGYPQPPVLIRSATTGALSSNDSLKSRPTTGILSNTSNTPEFLIDPNGSLVTEVAFGELYTTVNDLRHSILLQSLLELDARGGTRYVEILKAHFNVISPDFRLQRPEFLSMATTRINQHVVPQTSETGTSPQANLAAYSTSSNYGNNVGFSKSFVEHGFIFGLVQARADVTYQQGINRMWTRQTRYDYFWPKLQEIGEQEVYNYEIFWGNDSLNYTIFGYQERYAEYRYKPSEIRGQFRSTFAQTLDVWHLAEEFNTRPSLNSTFIESNTPIERSLVVTANYPHLLFDAWFDYKHARPMMTYGVPATLGRF